MRNQSLSRSVRFAIAFAFLAAAPAQAGTLSSASWTADLFGNPVSVPITITGTSTATAVSVSVTVPQFTTAIFIPGGVVGAFSTLKIGGAQVLTATPSMAAATAGVPARQALRLASHTAGSMDTPATTVFKVLLGVGKAGTFTTFFYFGATPHYVTLDIYGWTPHTKTFTGLTNMGSPLPTVVAMGSFNLNANGGGNVLLVAPSRLSIDGPLVQRRTAGFTSLKLTFVPEPGTLLLLVAAGLGLLATRRT